MVKTKGNLKLKNRLNHWRHILKMEKGEFAEFLDVHPALYSQWENHKKEPNLESAWLIVQKIRLEGHNCHIDDLYEVDSTTQE